MTVYVIRGDKVAAHSALPAKPGKGAIVVRSPADLAKLPEARLIAVWNNIPGQTPMPKYKDREAAANQMWAELKRWANTPGKSRPKHRPVKQGRAGPAKAPGRAKSKQAKVIALLRRSEGATIEEMTKATGWQPHSVRGIISGAIKKKLGFAVASAKEKRGRVYRIVEAGAAKRA